MLEGIKKTGEMCMKSGINVIIFDFDGVIINSGADIANAVNYALRHFDRPLLPKDEIIANAMPVYREYYLENCIIETVLYENVKETLEFFKDKKIGLVTNKPENLTFKILEELGIREYFKIVIGPESVKKLKPDPEGLLKVIDAFGEEPAKAIMVGDSYTDVEAGRGAGTYTCGVTYGLGSSVELVNASPDFVIDDIIQLTKL
jgi:phosphoglycolate phosphatase